ncbi:CidA/LrgA family protein [Ihubacter massiliensis]|uniref:CidA/LrgA family protein n=1 Tax=Hominibacterium faecale TaxID=2839743 RepID=A0A9J6QJJ7_9FIRM|nr:MULTISPECIES: CidA/LrgA family protein [Eubacteriales Family XIII. Incertae Sedis]MCO7121792.1 CidA/LrgA family protein [Ihubacter massiliensis]MCU7377664.1 CidA/LrgA family protein [Hominibacterium faecale]MCU7379199.1 CidA/LrgA family protein [Hominibacterium faecale]
MKYLAQFGIILAVTFAGELLNRFIPAPIPASIYGLVILLVLLLTGIVKVGHIKETSDFLIAVMPLMFVPPAVGLMESWGVLSGKLLPILAVLVISTIFVMAVTGLVIQALAGKTGRSKG